MKLMDVKEVVETYGIPKKMLYDMIRNGEMPRVRLGPRRIKLHPKDVEKFIEQNRGYEKDGEEIDKK